MNSGSLSPTPPPPRPQPRAPAATPTAGRPQPLSGRAAPALAGIAIAAVVLVHIVDGGWGSIWLLLPEPLIARRVTCH